MPDRVCGMCRFFKGDDKICYYVMLVIVTKDKDATKCKMFSKKLII